jgi:hypothetical protein
MISYWGVEHGDEVSKASEGYAWDEKERGFRESDKPTHMWDDAKSGHVSTSKNPFKKQRNEYWRVNWIRQHPDNVHGYHVRVEGRPNNWAYHPKKTVSAYQVRWMKGQGAQQFHGSPHVVRGGLTGKGKIAVAGAGVAAAGTGAAVYQNKKKDSVAKYYQEERAAYPDELAAQRQAHPIKSRLRPKKYSFGAAYADDDGNYGVMPGVKAGSSGLPNKQVKRFSRDVYPPKGVQR